MSSADHLHKSADPSLSLAGSPKVRRGAERAHLSLNSLGLASPRAATRVEPQGSAPTTFTTHRSAAPAAASSRVGPIEKRSIRSAGTPADNYMEE